jgi:L-fuculose-phosphate aldolase
MLPAPPAEIVAAFRQAGADLYAAGLVGGRGGSLSVWTPEGILITRRDAPLGHLSAGDLCLVGRSTVAGEQPPALDTPIHRAVYIMTDGRALAGVQPLHALALAAEVERLDLGDALGELALRQVLVLRHARDIVREVGEALAQSVAVLVRGHAAFVRGVDLAEAAALAEALERAARLRWLERTLNAAPPSPLASD